MKQKSEGIGLVVGRVQRIEEEAANASLKVILLLLFFCHCDCCLIVIVVFCHCGCCLIVIVIVVSVVVGI